MTVGIKPTGGGLPALSLDTRQELVDDLRVSADEVGTRVGQVQSEIYATAQSANTSAGELASRVKYLEERATVTKDGEGRIQATDPASPDDVATKRYVDASAPSEEIVSGPGWRAKRWGKIITLVCLGVTQEFTVPPAFRPFDRIYVSVSLGKTSPNGRIGVLPSGKVELIDVSTSGAYAAATYLAV